MNKLKQPQIKKKEAPKNKTLKKLGNGALLIGFGLAMGSRLELYMQSSGITPTQCEVKTVSESAFDIVDDIGTKKKGAK